MKKIAIAILFTVACGGKPSGTNPALRFACNEGTLCPAGQECVPPLPGAVIQHACCGGPPCSSALYPGLKPGDVDGGAPADLAPNLSGCKDGKGKPVYPGDPNGVRQWLCPTLIAAGEIQNKCAPGWKLCTTTLITTDRLELCENELGGFYASAMISNAPNVPPPDTATACNKWSGAPATNQRFIHGCGNAPGVYNFTANACGSYRHAVNCRNGSQGNQSASFSCPAVSGDIDIDLVTNTDPNSGVTCCKIGA